MNDPSRSVDLFACETAPILHSLARRLFLSEYFRPPRRTSLSREMGSRLRNMTAIAVMRSWTRTAEFVSRGIPTELKERPARKIRKKKIIDSTCAS